jgi:GNAT superfamily N-acetyltransferase
VDDALLSLVPADSPEARQAMAQYFEELGERLPSGFDPGAALDEALVANDPPRGAFVLARAGDEVVGCGAITLLDERTAEIKRMWVSPAVRGRGLGRRLLARLEEEARRAGCRTVVLDTSTTLTEAVAMYEAAGYTPTEPYNDNPYAERWFARSLSVEVPGGLGERLGLPPGADVAVLHAPDDLDEGVGPLLADATVRHGLRRSDSVDLIIGFVTSRSHLEGNIGWLVGTLRPGGGFLVVWPTAASEVETDLSAVAVGEVATPLGLVATPAGPMGARWTAVLLTVEA